MNPIHIETFLDAVYRFYNFAGMMFEAKSVCVMYYSFYQLLFVLCIALFLRCICVLCEVSVLVLWT